MVETVRTPDGPRQRPLCYLGELNDAARARWLKTTAVFNQHGESRQLKLFPSTVKPPPGETEVAQVLVDRVRLERTRRFGDGFLGRELWRRLELDRFFEQCLDRADDAAEVPWSHVAAVLAINRLCAPGAEGDSHRNSTVPRTLPWAASAFRGRKGLWSLLFERPDQRPQSDWTVGAHRCAQPFQRTSGPCAPHLRALRGARLG